MNRSLFVVLAAVAALPAPAVACPPPLLPPQLPGETDKAYQDRSSEMLGAQTYEGRRSSQIAYGEHAKATFLGVVTDSHEIDLDGGTKGHEVTVRPVRAIKGELPSSPAILRDGYITECGNVGGGTATGAAAGDYVIVFQGVDTGWTPSTGNYGILASEARDPFLVKSLFDFTTEPASH